MNIFELKIFYPSSLHWKTMYMKCIFSSWYFPGYLMMLIDGVKVMAVNLFSKVLGAALKKYRRD